MKKICIIIIALLQLVACGKTYPGYLDGVWESDKGYTIHWCELNLNHLTDTERQMYYEILGKMRLVINDGQIKVEHPEMNEPAIGFSAIELSDTELDITSDDGESSVFTFTKGRNRYYTETEVGEIVFREYFSRVK